MIGPGFAAATAEDAMTYALKGCLLVSLGTFVLTALLIYYCTVHR